MVEDLLCTAQGDKKQPQRVKHGWKKPEPGRYKVNTDAAFQESSSIAATGAVLRDEDGCLIAAAAKRYMHLSDVLTAEAIAARDGLILAITRGCQRITLDVDNLALFNLMQSDMGERSVVAGLWQEIRELSRMFEDFKFSFVYREGNEAARPGPGQGERGGALGPQNQRAPSPTCTCIYV
ncbi:hypothetical protein HU200_033208 [Digitaria exilis]|uniref:RNase H type-1 domain-containing protein n=1 Tax=Digitaria exilis TaxID=1010633 RepID=A0A835ERF6_9POAL|nr:hypothetical protein HU200_033208 [Digitaria exilis]